MSGDRPGPEHDSEPEGAGAPREAADPAPGEPEPAETEPAVTPPAVPAPAVTPQARERPRPQYGEYATPQRQAEVIAGSLPPVSPLLKPGTTPAASSSVRPTAHPPGPQRAARRGASAAPAAAPGGVPASERPRRRWDLVLSIALLAYGLLTIFGGLTQYRDIPSIIDQAYEAQGIGEFTSTELASTVGIVIVVVHTLLYVITALVTVRLLQARRLAFYVPVIGGVLAILVAITLILVLMLSDPAFNAYIGSAS